MKTIFKISFIAFILFTSALFGQKISTIQNFRQAEAEAKEQRAKQNLLPAIEQSENQAKYDVLYYGINLRLDPGNTYLSGDALTTVNILGDLELIELNLINAYSVDSVFVDNKRVSTNHSSNILTVHLERIYTTGEQLNIQVFYQGNPNTSGYRSFRFDRFSNETMIWSSCEPYGSRTWWPCKDFPVDKADSVDIRLTVPSDLTVASNGVLMEKKINGNWTTWWWHEKYPIVTYLVSVAIHPFDFHVDHYIYNGGADSMDIEFYTFGNNWNNYLEENLMVKEMIGAFSGMFGQYPFVDEKYGHADYLGGGAMEHQTCSSFSFWGEEVYAHELAHQWWGDLITCESFHHIWLNEGFATYCEALWYEYKYGKSHYKQAMASTAYYGSGTIIVEDPLTQQIFSGSLSYNKANWVIHMLRHVMGDETFFLFLGEYYTEFAHSTINTAQFKNLAERVCGKQLDNFFQQWIYGERYPQYEFFTGYEKLDNGQYKIKGMIYQTQTGQVFDMPVDLNIHMVRAESTHVVQVNKREVPFELIVDTKPMRIELDEDDWILKTVTEITDPILTPYDVVFSDSTGNNNSIWEPGESVKVITTIQNKGAGTTKLEATLSTEDEDVEIIQSRASIEDISIFDTASNKESPFVIKAKSTAKHHVAEFTLTIKRFDEVLSTQKIYVNLGRPRVLVVDDDAGSDYEIYYKRMTAMANILAETWDIQQKGIPTLETLNKYMGLIWFTGDVEETTLAGDEQNLISRYLNQGGKLLLAGQYIANDLKSTAPTFLNDVLKTDFITQLLQVSPIFGIDGDPISNELFGIFDDTYFSAENQKVQSIINPIDGAMSCFNYSNNKTAGLRIEDETNNSKIVFLSFALEAIGGPDENTASQIVQQAMIWLMGSTPASTIEPESMPTEFVLKQNYPNPFNPTTTIRFALPQNEKVELAIFNSLGQKVRQLVSGSMVSGWHTIQWNGANDTGEQVSSGIYLLSLRMAQSSVLTTKMVKLQ